jgi:hypothetical protein
MHGEPGASKQIPAQVVTVGVSGSLAALNLSLNRVSGSLVIEIREVTNNPPNGVVTPPTPPRVWVASPNRIKSKND